MANEKRLIDANALQLEPDPWSGMNGVLILGRSGGKTMAMVQSALKRMIDNAPTVDAVEVVHGRWMDEDCAGIRCNGYMACSVCNVMIPKPDNCRYCLPRLYYCPKCGAKMDGDGNG